MSFADPNRPVELTMPGTTQSVLIVVFGAAAVLALVRAVRESQTRRDLVPLYVVLGAALAIWYEPVADVLIHCYYPERGQVTWIHAFGLDIPAFIGIAYVWYMTAGAFLLLRCTHRGVSTREWWAGWLGFGVFATVLEITCVQLGDDPWVYYGPQAFEVGGIPVLTTFNYVSFVLAIGAGVCVLAWLVPRRLQWMIIPAVPMLLAASHVATALPMAIALNGTEDTTLIAIGSLGTTLLSIGFSYVLSQAFHRPWPMRAPIKQGDATTAAALQSPFGAARRKRG